MKEIFMDIETYSTRDLAKCGVYPYAEDPDFQILLIAYSVDRGPVQQTDLASGEEVPEEFMEALQDPRVLKWAYNANFERVCLSRLCWDRRLLKKGKYLDPESWRCSMVLAAANGLPLSLAEAGAVLGVEKQKMAEGKELIKFFCTEDKTKGTEYSRHTADEAPEKWDLFKKYNKRDVETELEIHNAIETMSGGDLLPQQIWKEYAQDQQINDRGIRIDRKLASKAASLDASYRAEMRKMLADITGLQNPASVQQLQGWLRSKGIVTDSLGKDTVDRLLADPTLAPDVRMALKLRKQLAKTSVSKYEAMLNAACQDGRARGNFQFYGASRTGRFSGRLIQLQNLPQNHLEHVECARELVRECAESSIRQEYPDIPDLLSQLVRTALIARPKNYFAVCDYSAIEARILSWLAGEDWRMQVFRTGGDIYSASASEMFHVPVEKHGVNSELRQKGKIAELALGYGGSVGALKAMGALERGLDESELPGLVQRWRNSNPRIVRFWRAVDQAVVTAVKTGTDMSIQVPGQETRLNFRRRNGRLIITLPSGRSLVYWDAQIRESRFGGPCVTYMGVNAAKKWERIESYGPKFVENIVQGIARDVLCDAMLKLQRMRIVAHVHDEIIVELPSREDCFWIRGVMSSTPEWAPGLYLSAEDYSCWFYQKI